MKCKSLILGVISGFTYFYLLLVVIPDVIEGENKIVVNEKIYINESTPVTPNDGYSYYDEITYYQNGIHFLNYISAKSMLIFILLIALFWSILESVFYPVGRKLEGSLLERIFTPSALPEERRLKVRKNINQYFYGLLISSLTFILIILSINIIGF